MPSQIKGGRERRAVRRQVEKKMDSHLIFCAPGSCILSGVEAVMDLLNESEKPAAYCMAPNCFLFSLFNLDDDRHMSVGMSFNEFLVL